MHIIDVFNKKKVKQIPPVWMMRQAGRYLPEYKKVRSNFKDFIEFCFTPDAVTEVTLQPIDRFDLDAAIIFSDILVIPHVLGQTVWFEENYGPRLADVSLEKILENSIDVVIEDSLSCVGLAIQNTRSILSNDKALLGFSGAPWTLLTYMISQGKTSDFNDVLIFAHNDKVLFSKLLDMLSHKVAELLILHIKSGANAVQIFESWAGAVPEHLRNEYLFNPLRKIIDIVRKNYPDVPIVYYGRGIATDYINIADLSIIFGVDENANLADIKSMLPFHVLQGNLSPSVLLSGENLDENISSILNVMTNHPFVFNLGHGINKDTPISHVERMLFILRENKI